MQFGHLGIALAIASLDPRPETFLVVGAAQFLPNADSLIIRAGWARPDFHGTWSHSLLFSSAVGALAVALFGPWLGGLALASIVRSEEHTSELQSLAYLVCRLLLEKKKTKKRKIALSTSI